MTKKELFDAIHQCKEEYLLEVFEGESNKKIKDEKRFFEKKKYLSVKRIAVAALISILFVATGVSVLATASPGFRNWLNRTFGGEKVTRVIPNNDEPDIKVNKKSMLFLKDNMQILGEKESFVCEYHFKGDDEVVDKVYSIQENGLKQLKINSFQGEYDGEPFSFEYAVIHKEVCGFNYKGAVNEIFHYKKGDAVYAALWKDGKNAGKGCIVKLNLKTKEITKLTDDHKLCNFLMSPNGKVILCNYRSKGYWTVFDLDTKTEKKVPGIDGYAHTSEIRFLDDYHVLTLGKTFMKNDTELTGTYEINLHTGKVMKEYKDYGDINIEWSYTLKSHQLKVYNIINKEMIEIEKVDDVHTIEVKGDYVLFGTLENEEAVFYLLNLKNQTFMKINVPQKMHSNVEMYLAAKEKKLLLTNGKEAYLADVSKLK